MEESVEAARERIMSALKEIGGFTWEDAEKWAGMCNAMGMDPVPFLKVLLCKICAVKTAGGGARIPSKCDCVELWIDFKANRTRFEVVGPGK